MNRKELQIKRLSFDRNFRIVFAFICFIIIFFNFQDKTKIISISYF